MTSLEQEKQLVAPEEDRSLAKRLMFLFFIVFLIFSALVVRLAYIQLVRGEEYLTMLENNQLKQLPITAPRGRILDANGVVLVDNKTVFTVTFQPLDDEEQDVDRIAQILADLVQDDESLRMSKEEILELMDVGAKRSSLYIPRRIMSNITPEMVAYIEEHRAELPGVEVVTEPMRDYKFGKLLAHVIGYTRPVPAEQKERYLARGYRVDDRVGYDGLEAQYEFQLKGKDGYKEVVVNRHYETMETRKVVQPVPGNDLVLTIDHQFQAKVEAILEETVKTLQKEQPELGVTQASAVVLQPKTGAVLALANYPSYDPNLYNYPLSQEVYETQIRYRDQNIAISGTYTPGSVVKPVTVMMGMQEGLITPQTKLNSGIVYFGVDRRSVTDGGRVKGPINSRVALQRSSNVFMVNIGIRWVERYPGSYVDLFDEFDRYYQMFGLGQKTGIDLPGEKIGLRNHAKQYGNLLYMTFGQYHNYTPMQLAQFVATVANDGYRMQPYLVQEIREGSQNGELSSNVLWRHTPKVLNRVDIDPAYIREAQEGMRLVAAPGGTGYSVYAGLPFQVAAKTGTAQTGAGNNSLIVGYAPYQNPEVAFVVVVPKGGGGSAVSGPVSRKILEAYFGLDEE